MLNLGTRLKTVAEYVRKGSRVCDIGTDHAFLPAYLVMNNIAEKALACDLRKGPLFNAEKTVKQYHLEDKIELRLSDGFDKINPDEADDFLLCGMGGTLMTGLLQKAEWLKNKKYRLILQPQSHCEEVRNYLIRNGFEIINEAACSEANKYYNLIVAEYTGAAKEYSNWYIHFGNLIFDKSEAALKINQQVLKLLKIKCDAEKNYYSAENYERLKSIITDAEEILNGN